MKDKHICKCGHPESSHLANFDNPTEWCIGALSCKCKKYRPGLKLRKKK